MTAVTLPALSGEELVSAIHARKRLTDELKAADDVHTAAVQASVAGYGDWRDVQQAGEFVRQCRAALKAVGEEQ